VGQKKNLNRPSLSVKKRGKTQKKKINKGPPCEEGGERKRGLSGPPAKEKKGEFLALTVPINEFAREGKRGEAKKSVRSRDCKAMVNKKTWRRHTNVVPSNRTDLEEVKPRLGGVQPWVQGGAGRGKGGRKQRRLKKERA